MVKSTDIEVKLDTMVLTIIKEKGIHAMNQSEGYMILKTKAVILAMGCSLKVDAEEKKVTGNACSRGKEYGINEVLHPVRVITSVVTITNGTLPVLPVKTNGAISKQLNFACMEEINKVTVFVPVKLGDVVIENVLETGVDVVATRDMEKVK